MKTVFLIRHAKSSWTDPDLADHDRPLNNRGIKDAPMMAEIFKDRYGEDIDAIVSSTAKRADSTAQIFADALDFSGTDRFLHSAQLYCSMSRDVHEIIRSLPEAWTNVVLFGHNPSFTSIANQFDTEPIHNIPTCGIVRIDAPIDSWKNWSARKGAVNAFIFPKMFK